LPGGSVPLRDRAFTAHVEDGFNSDDSGDAGAAPSGHTRRSSFTSDQTARFTGDFTGINPGGFGSNWCGASFVVTGKFDLTAMADLK
jgi:hypothetical protein